MATLIVPAIERDEHKIWASLGEALAEWLEEFAVYGPGSKHGKPVVVDDEFFGWLVRTYQVYPHGHPREGRRRFKRAAAERAKGTGKTEWAVIVAQAENHPTAPIRTLPGRDGWERRGRAWVPVGGPVPYPRLIFVASSEDQVQRTAFGRYREALKRSPLAADYHITNEKIILLGEGGAAGGESYPLAISAGAADGDLPTWQNIDESHRWKLQRHHDMHDTIVENSLKDETADSWVMMTSTAGTPGEDSVEERTLEYAEAIEKGQVENPSFFFHRRFAPLDMPLETFEEVEAAVREARGPAAAWSGDIPNIVNRYFEPKVDRMYWRRVWLNQWLKGARAAFDMQRWRANALQPNKVERGDLITIGFDGSLSQDATALIATSVYNPHQWKLGIWERPFDAGDDWEIPFDEVDQAVEEAFATYEVWRLYGDPFRWREPLDRWRGKYGDKRVLTFNTTRWKAMGYAIRNYEAAIRDGAFTNDGDETFDRHMANARRKVLQNIVDEDGQALWVLTKDRQSEFIDGPVAGGLSWEGRNDAIAAGAKKQQRGMAVFV